MADVGTTYKKLVRFLGSRLFFGFSLIAFTAQACWIAISSRYPMAFDEAYHLGLIKLHAKQLSPIFTHQPPGPAVYGALTRDPSYLYHWLMSFPYRFVSNLTPSFTLQIVTLRLINVALFLCGIVLFKLVLDKTKASRAFINLALLFFSLTPVVSLLAAHINYDNLLVPCVAGSLLLTLRLREVLLTKQTISTRAGLGLIGLVCLSAEVTYPFLPIMAGCLVYISYLFITYRPNRRGSLIKNTWRDWSKVSKLQKVALVGLAVVGVGLFSYTYGINVITYHNPIPQCGQVLGQARCQAYGPWARNYRAAHHIANSPNLGYFIVNWLAGMFERLFFVINGSTGPAVYQNYLAPIMAGVAALGGGIGLGVYLKHLKQNLASDRALGALLFVGLVYILALFGRNYHDYVQLGEMVAINGRYLVPIILPFYLAAAIGWRQLLTGRTMKLKLSLLLASCLLCLQGGGITSYIAYSNQYWYWPHEPWIISTNQRLHDLEKPFIWAPKIR